MGTFSSIFFIAVVVFIIYLLNSDAAKAHRMEEKLKEKKALDDFEKAKAFVNKISYLSYEERIDEIVRLSNEDKDVFYKIEEYKLLDKSYKKN